MNGLIGSFTRCGRPAVTLLLGLAVVLAVGPGTPRALAQSEQGILFALMTRLGPECMMPPPMGCESAIEVVDLATMSTLRSFSIGPRHGISLAVSPDAQRVYVADDLNREVAVFDAVGGTLIATVPLAFPRDSVLSADGSTLYVGDLNSMLAIDATTLAVTRTLATGSDTPLGIALSRDGRVLAAPSTDGGSNPALYLADTATLALIARVPISNPGEPPNCGTFPVDVALTDTGLALLWDSNCDNLYQVDVATATQLTAGTIRMGRDEGGFDNFNNMLNYSPLSGRAYALKESRQLAVMDPATATGFLHGGFDGVPFVPSLTPDGRSLFIAVIHRFEGGGSDTLDRYDTLGDSFVRRVYTFATPNLSVRDMRIVAPRGPLSVAIDIKPGSFPNSINLGSSGTVPVAILSSATFDATTVDPATVTLAGAAVRLTGKGMPIASFRDVNGDGLTDLVVHILTDALHLSCGDTEAVLEGRTFDGQAIRGSDTVRIVP